MLYELLSKLLVSPLISPIVVPYIIPYITPFKEFRLQLILRSRLYNELQKQSGVARSGRVSAIMSMIRLMGMIYVPH